VRHHDDIIMRTLFIVWSGRLVSIVGSGLTGFALLIRVYRQSRSGTMLACIMPAATVPGVLVPSVAMRSKSSRGLLRWIGGDRYARSAHVVMTLPPRRNAPMSASRA